MSRWARTKGIDKFEREWNDDTSYIGDVIDASPRPAWLVSRVTHLLAAAALVGGVGLAAPAAAQVSDQPPAVSVYTLTPERIAATAAAVVGLIGAVIGGLALARSAGRIGTGNGRRGAIVALGVGHGFTRIATNQNALPLSDGLTEDGRRKSASWLRGRSV
jgi:hypothetical protein